MSAWHCLALHFRILPQLPVLNPRSHQSCRHILGVTTWQSLKSVTFRGPKKCQTCHSRHVGFKKWRLQVVQPAGGLPSQPSAHLAVWWLPVLSPGMKWTQRLQRIPWLKRLERLETSTNVSLISESIWRFPSSKWPQNVWNAEERQPAQSWLWVTTVSDYIGAFARKCPVTRRLKFPCIFLKLLSIKVEVVPLMHTPAAFLCRLSSFWQWRLLPNILAQAVVSVR